MVRSITFLEAGHTEQLEKIVNPVSGKWRKIRFPSTVALLEHPKQGYILFDAGYSGKFHEITRKFPERLYAWVTPVSVTPETSAVGRLRTLGIAQEEIRHLALSHFHADHIGGAGDFTRARYLASKREYQGLLGKTAFHQVRHGFLRGLLPDGFEGRTDWVDEFPVPLSDLGPGWTGRDWFGDGSVFLVPLPGHTLGQVGLYVPSVGGKDYLLVADAAWLTASVRQGIEPMGITRILFDNHRTYCETLARIHRLHAQSAPGGRLRIMTCHCEEALAEEREARV
jgi:glyoxylase-like metal-dependent hydrolase (beta-lactamase superfamily II)